MFCPYCGKEIPGTAEFCPYCGNRIHRTATNAAPYQGGEDTQPSGAKSASAPARPTAPDVDHAPKKHHALFIALAVLAGIFLCAGIIYVAHYFANAKSARAAQQQFEMAEAIYDTIIQEIEEIEAPYLDTDGCVDPAEQKALLADVYQFAKEQRQKGTLTDCAYQDGDTMVYMQINGWYGVLYDAPLRDMMAGGTDISITTLEPYAGTLGFSVTHAAANGKGADQAADELEAKMDGFHFTGNYDGDAVNVEFLENNDFSNSVVMWVGHGGYDAEAGSVLFLGTPRMDRTTYILRQQEMADGALFRNNRGFYSVNKVFVEKYMQDDAFANSLVYLGGCSTAQDQLETQDGLIQAMLNKGARFVMGNSTTVSLIYNYSMIYTFFDGMTQQHADGSYYTVSEALNYARGKHGDFDNVVETGCFVWGDGEDIALTDLQGYQDTKSENNTMPLSANDLTWSLEPTLDYDDIEPVWSIDFSDVGVPPSGQKVADANTNIFSDESFSGAEMNFPAYSCLEEYYAVHRGNESRLFYMPSQQESPFYDFTSERNWFVFDSTGIMYDLRSDHPYFEEWIANGGNTYGFPWNILTTGARGGGGIELLWDKKSQKAYFVFGGEGIWRMKPAGLSDLHKLYAIREAEGTGQLPAQEAITYSEETGQIASLKGVGKYAIWAPDKGVITDFIYDEVSTSSYGLIAVSKDGKWGYLDENGNEVTPLEFDGVWQTSVSDMDYETNSQGYILSTIYHYNLQAYPCTSDTMVVSKNGEWGVLYRDGTLLIGYGQFEDMAPAWNNQLWAKKDGKWGLIDLAAAKQKAGLPEWDVSQPFQEATEEERTGNTAFSGLDVQPDIVIDSGERRQCEVIANPSLILRRGPGTEYERIDTIPYGSLVEEIGRSNETDAWIVTQYNGMVGWVSTQYLDYKTSSNGEITGNNDSSYSVPGTNIVLDYEVKDNEIAITKCNLEAEGILEIPQSINGLPVTSIGADSMSVAFSGCAHITKIILPDTIKTIERISFWSCYRLESIFIPRSVTYISTDVFDHCGSLTDIYYEGSEEDWQNIDIGSSNTELKDATIHFNAAR